MKIYTYTVVIVEGNGAVGDDTYGAEYGIRASDRNEAMRRARLQFRREMRHAPPSRPRRCTILECRRDTL
jgi:hypothetical protein